MIDVFYSGECDSSQHGEGRHALLTVNVTVPAPVGGGDMGVGGFGPTFTLHPPRSLATGDWITATATDFRNAWRITTKRSSPTDSNSVANHGTFVSNARQRTRRNQSLCCAAGPDFAPSLGLPDFVSLETWVIVGFSQLPVTL